MKKIFNILTIVAGAALLVLSCGKKELDTNQFPATSEVVLKSYGPRPVVRGGVLRFVGMNLDQVASVTIPGCEPITDIEVITSGVPSEIHVTVPKEEAEVGTVILTTKAGKTIETATPLSYIETIVLDKITPEEAYPGEVITIEGDYLQFIHEVIFSNKVYVSEKDFVSQDRYSIKVTVPEEAQTGRLGIGTIDETVEKDEDVLSSLNVLEAPFVVKTAVGTVSGEYKAGETITISGTKLSLVKSLELEGATVTDFTATDSKITFTLPAEASDGDVIMVMASGVEVNAGSITTKVPTELVADPATIKNGGVLTVTGKDIDLVTGVELPNAGWVDFTNDGKITFTVPEAAQAGDVTLHLANGKSVTVAYALVEPAITGFSANPASAGSDVTINGTNLDLVKSVTFGGDVTVDVEATETAITVAVPTAAETGVLVLNLKNGASVEGIELAIDKPAGAYIASMPGDLYSPGDMFIIDIENADHLTGVQFDGVDVTYILSGNTLYVQIPSDAKADTTITLVSDNGSVTYPMNIDPGDFIVTPIWTGEFALGSWGGLQDLAWGKYDWSTVKVGQILRIEAESALADGEWYCYQLKSGTKWDPLAGAPGQIDNPSNPYDIVLNQEMIDDLQNNNGLVIQGYMAIIKRICIVDDLRYGTTIWRGEQALGSWGGLQALAWGGYDWSTVKAGQTLYVHSYPNVEAGEWYCYQLKSGTKWDALAGAPGQIDNPESPLGFKLNQEMVDDLINNNGLVIQGYMTTITAISLK